MHLCKIQVCHAAFKSIEKAELYLFIANTNRGRSPLPKLNVNDEVGKNKSMHVNNLSKNI